MFTDGFIFANVKTEVEPVNANVEVELSIVKFALIILFAPK
jgi:hypothetical protein